jgi:hypothetical protein
MPYLQGKLYQLTGLILKPEHTEKLRSRALRILSN